jgi:hypothetical protein
MFVLLKRLIIRFVPTYCHCICWEILYLGQIELDLLPVVFVDQPIIIKQILYFQQEYYHFHLKNTNPDNILVLKIK